MKYVFQKYHKDFDGIYCRDGLNGKENIFGINLNLRDRTKRFKR